MSKLVSLVQHHIKLSEDSGGNGLLDEVATLALARSVVELCADECEKKKLKLDPWFGVESIYADVCMELLR